MENINVKQFLEDLEQLVPSFTSEETKRFLEILAPFVRLMAKSGIGTDACLEQGCLPLPVHFYSPVPDLTDLKRRDLWNRRSQLRGIDWNIEKQVSFLKTLGELYGAECDWPSRYTGNPYQFYTENSCFSFGCAASTHCLLRHYKPKRVIEIGSGNSSLVIDAALALNAREQQTLRAGEYTIIDPYPQGPIKRGLPRLTKLIDQRVELIDPAIFEQLEANDVLFIDSGHTVRIGGDVNFLILDVLPTLAPGVIIHFHDISLPYEYPAVYYTNPSFRVFWTEAYLLQAFLCLNNQFEVLLAMGCLMREQKEAFRTAFVHYDPSQHHSESGSFWIRRKKPIEEG